MSETPNCEFVYLDFTPNHAKSPELREGLRDSLRSLFEQNLESRIDRLAQLPPIVVRNRGAEDIYVDLLIEAKEVFCSGLFYSCVASCRIVAERIIKDSFRRSVMVQGKEQSVCAASPEALDQLERIDVSSLTSFLRKSEIIDEQTFKAAKDLLELRNKYAHARGKNPEHDALKAITLLHQVLDGTVSVIKQVLRAGRLEITD